MFREGIININKPMDWTSQDVCAKLRGRLHIKRIGHTGTLDPMATGVLLVCIGRATRIIEYYNRDKKSYRATFKLGIKTDTLDITGETIEEKDFSYVSEEDVRRTIADYIGEIEQIPPKYSALKINGRPAYELARAGKEVSIKSRKIMIYDINIVEIDIKQGIVTIDVTCSKGTYIRTLCDDIGATLGCGATLTELVRTSNGCFNLENSVELHDLIEMSDEDLNSYIHPVEDTLINLGIVSVKNKFECAFSNGNTIDSNGYTIENDTNYDNMYKVLINGKFQGIGAVENQALVPRKVIAIDNI